ncbi:hypothetical protein EOE67_18525 [Rheinheimera riviphila]|uniref:DUF6701 domain-containing protein n=1 Tax=Rheinheimera riviphila TaxID=1834037 RepID=A0A437QFF5_9GAMM|nr:DUF6701 domain-containing protein [Rheinheimera riviphila]RVU33069.1 hypothetical protein EOE67_18525 [Rheinheimera riviphila]
MKKLAFKAWVIQWLTILSCCWIGQVSALGETCTDIWTQALKSTSTVPAKGPCFTTHADCYVVTGATNLNSLPANMTPGDYFLTAGPSITNNTTVSTTGATVRIFVNGSLTIENNVDLNWGGPPQNLMLVVSGSLTIRNNVRISGFILVGGAVEIGNSSNNAIVGGLTSKGPVSGGNNASLTFDSTALLLLKGGVICSGGLTCFNDDFSASSLSSSWAVSRSNGTFTPSIVNNRLRMTESNGNQSTAASYQRLFPGLANLVIVEFDQFAYGRTSGEGADGMAVVLSDASITPQPGAFGGPLGYGTKPGPPVIPGFAGGWLGVGLDEYGNYSAEGGVGTPGRRRQAVVLRGSGSGSSGYRYLAGTCSNGNTSTNGNCLSPAVDNNGVSGHRYKVTVDSRVSGQAMVKVERNTGGGYETLINSFNALSATGQAAVPTNFALSLTGSTGGANNIHELDRVQICALKSEPVGEQIDHFEFTYSGQALTCKAETFTIKACKNPACTELVTGSVSATLTPASGWTSGTGLTGGNVLNFSGGTATATLSKTTAGSVVVGVSSSVPSTKPLSSTLCQKGSATPTAADCKVQFDESGLVFSVPDKLAAKPVSGIVVRALKSDGSQSCAPTFVSVNRTVKFWSEYVNPTTLTATPAPARAVTVSHGATTNSIGKDLAGSTSFNLSFNASGEATIGLNYTDAGQLNLHAQYTGSAATNDAGLVMNGRDLFVSAPAGVCIITDTYCTTDSVGCPVYKKAGEAFTTTLSARAWQSDGDTNFCDNTTTTPSFILNAIPLRHSLVAPSGGVTGNLTPTSYNHVAQADANTLVATKISEVGIFNLQAGGNLTYLGMPINLGSSMNNPKLGRFVPDRFELVEGSIISGSCSSFHYLSQPATVNMTVNAVNAEGIVTQNYRQNFALATSSLVAENNNSGTDLTPRIEQFPVGMGWNNGVSIRSAAPFKLLRAATADGPFEQVLFGLQLKDNDGNRSELAGKDQLTTAAGICSGAACLSKVIHAETKWRYGRMQIVNALGSEQSNLPVQLKAEYFNGQQFVPNTLDNCSPVAPARLLVSAGTNPVLTVSGNPKNLSNGSSAAFDLLLSPPGVERPDPLIYPLQYQLSDYPWLQYDWNPGVAPLLENPTGEAVFGGFRGNNRQIFWREN